MAHKLLVLKPDTLCNPQPTSNTKSCFVNILSILSLQLGAGQTGVQSPAGVRDFLFSKKRPDQLWGPRSLLFNRYCCSFPGVKRPGHLTIHIHLLLRLIIGGAIPLIPLYTLMAWRVATISCSFLQTTFSAIQLPHRQAGSLRLTCVCHNVLWRRHVWWPRAYRLQSHVLFIYVSI